MKFRYLIAAMAALTLTFGCDDSLTAPEGNGQELEKKARAAKTSLEKMTIPEGKKKFL